MRILAINDISCIGKCSLSVTLPILSACSLTCDVLPTALLSTHTGGFENYTFRDLTEDMCGILAHWKTLGVQFDYIYSGYLGNIEQIETVLSVKNEFLAKNGKLIVDPVMGDNGALYAGFSTEYVEKMKELCRQADYVLPNATEASFLSGVKYPLTKENVACALEKLTQICPHPIITGITECGNISVYFKDESGQTHSLTHENVPGFFCGAGDVFASAFVAATALKKNEYTAISLAADFVTDCIRRSAAEVPDKRYGLNFEKEIFPFLQKLFT